jgi:hypothetical protein
LTSKYVRDTGRDIKFPSKISELLQDESIKGDHALVVQEDLEFDERARKGKLAAEALAKPLTFFEAVDAIPFPKSKDDDDKAKKQKKKKDEVMEYSPEHMIQKIDLSGYKNLRFSRAGLQELVLGIERLPVIRSVNLKNNGINDDFEKEILTLMSISKVQALDLSNNEIEKMGMKIGKLLLNSVTHFTWLDLSLNNFIYDTQANTTIIQGFKK